MTNEDIAKMAARECASRVPSEDEYADIILEAIRQANSEKDSLISWLRKQLARAENSRK